MGDRLLAGIPPPQYVTTYKQSNSTFSLVSTWMGDRLLAGIPPPQYVTSHPGQLSLAIPLWVVQ